MSQFKTEITLELGIMRNEIDQFKDEVIHEFGIMRSEIDQFKDEVTGAILEMRDEVAVLTGYKDDIEEHEVRIDKLEEKVFSAKN
ncbi:MAG TPA: hypothetical protein PLS49_01980 [Candidatus Woesebacteria bacterium]|nr:hypothetical protein [Candidatus Woesebacteria bacterium]